MRIVDASQEELYAFVHWFNKLYGYHPIVIGGWAVYFYNPYYGSVDIDVLFEDEKTREDWITEYLCRHGYGVHERLGVKAYRKPVKIGEGTSHIDIDAMLLKQKNVFLKYPNISLPYSLILEYTKDIERQSGAGTIYLRIPQKSLLFLYKAMAAIDREMKYRRERDPTRKDYLRSKFLKDTSDLISLLDAKSEDSMDKTIFHELAPPSFRKLLVAELDTLLFHPSALGFYRKCSEDELKRWYADFKKHIMA